MLLRAELTKHIRNILGERRPRGLLLVKRGLLLTLRFDGGVEGGVSLRPFALLVHALRHCSLFNLCLLLRKCLAPRLVFLAGLGGLNRSLLLLRSLLFLNQTLVSTGLRCAANHTHGRTHQTSRSG
ncbi:hypothetical protein D3C72_1199760 [compost metagenome]